MTLSIARIPTGLQLLGIGMALLALLLMLVAPYCASSAHVQLAAIVVAIDSAAVWLRRSASAIPLALLGLGAAGATILMVVSCAPPGVGYQPLVDQGVAQGILLASSLPSIVGAWLQRYAR